MGNAFSQCGGVFTAILCGVAAPATISLTPVRADVLFFDITADPEAWEKALDDAGVVLTGALDFGDLPDFGLRHSDPPYPPLCHEGNDIVPSGFVPFGVCFDGFNADQGEAAHVDYVGPSTEFVTSNAIVSGYFIDAFEAVVDEPVRAMEFRAVTLLGSSSVDLTVFNGSGEEIGGLDDASASEPGGRRWGILATENDDIAHILIHDLKGGAEGIMTFAMWDDPNSTGLADFQIVIGSLNEGELDYLTASDNVRLSTTSGFGPRLSEAHLLEMIVSAETSISEPEMLNVAIESFIDEPSGVAKVALRNWRTQRFDRVGQYAIGESEITVLLEEIAASAYVNETGAIELQIKHVVFVPFVAFEFDSFFDLVEIEVE